MNHRFMPETLSLRNSNSKKRKVTDPNARRRAASDRKHMAITMDRQADIWNSRLLSVLFNIETPLSVVCDIIHHGRNFNTWRNPPFSSPFRLVGSIPPHFYLSLWGERIGALIPLHPLPEQVRDKFRKGGIRIAGAATAPLLKADP
jgi:hypothetical protein